MAETQENVVVHRHVLKGAEDVENGLSRIGEAGRKVSEIGDEVRRSLLGIVGISGGLFAIGESVREVGRLYDGVQRVSAAAEVSSSEADALLSTFQRFGVPLESAERDIIRMTAKGQLMEEHMTGMVGQAKSAMLVFARIGVAAGAGPAKTMEAMARAAQRGKLTLQEVREIMQVRPDEAAKLMTLFKQGPEKLRESMNEVRNSAGVIDDHAMETWRKMKQAVATFKDAVLHLLNVFIKQIIPVIQPFMDTLSERVKSWEPYVKAFAEVLGKGLVFAANHARMILLYMTATKLVAMATGKSIAGWGQTGASSLFKAVTTPAATARFVENAAGDLVPAAGGGAIAAEGGAGLAVLAPVLIALSAAAVLAAGAFYGVKENLEGVGDYFYSMVEEIRAEFGIIGDSLAGVFGESSAFQMSLDILHYSAKQIAGKLDLAMALFSEVLVLVITVGKHIKAVWDGLHGNLTDNLDITKAYADAQSDVYVRMSANKKLDRDQALRKTDDTRQGPGNVNFTNPVFHIEQKFAEGYDPDRIVMAFKSELAVLGERSRQSGLAPINSPR